ncbi:MAG: nucleotidyl transferase AbiEii/AbiGii toxin family protein [Candidatus Diapherotrites archaeon]|nr:nucleotidyl transferase AbiEii/AbiGii toxin family protein [Candidatus Diapherotrites archaeon]
MVYVRKKRVKGHEYYYEVESKWTPKGPRQKVKRYLGKGVIAVGGADLFGRVGEREIKRAAARTGVPYATIEKDYVLSYFLAVLSTKKFFDYATFKGGTALAMCYLSHHRFSEDLDFSANPRKRRGVIKAVRSAAAELGLHVKKERDTKQCYLAKLQYIGPSGHKDNIQVDVRFRKVALAPVEKKLKAGYEGVPAATVKVYDLRELVAEKIAAMVERAEPRDFFDVWYILKHKRVKLNEVGKLAHEKCSFSMKKVFEGEEKVKLLWESRLGRLVVREKLPPFDEVREYLNKRLSVFPGKKEGSRRSRF